jgi:hypothetical protein
MNPKPLPISLSTAHMAASPDGPNDEVHEARQRLIDETVEATVRMKVTVDEAMNMNYGSEFTSERSVEEGEISQDLEDFETHDVFEESGDEGEESEDLNYSSEEEHRGRRRWRQGSTPRDASQSTDPSLPPARRRENLQDSSELDDQDFSLDSGGDSDSSSERKRGRKRVRDGSDPESSFMDVDEDSSSDESFRGRRRSRPTSRPEQSSGDERHGRKRYREASEPITPDKYSEGKRSSPKRGRHDGQAVPVQYDWQPELFTIPEEEAEGDGVPVVAPRTTGQRLNWVQNREAYTN